MPDPLRSRVFLRLDRAVTGEELAALCHDAGAQLALGHGRRIHCDVGALTVTDRAVVESVARLALVARRHGAVVVLVDPAPQLRSVLELTGLAQVVETAAFRGRDGGAGRRSGRASRYRGRS